MTPTDSTARDRTASGLDRYCGLKLKLSRENEKPARTQRAATLGTEFHSIAAAHLSHQPLPPMSGATVSGWYAKMLERLIPELPQSVTVEMAVGLAKDGSYVEVHEPQPHVYVARNPTQQLSVGGRLDIAWNHYDTAIVVDIKTGGTALGAPDRLPQLQMLGLAYAAYTHATSLVVGIYYARSGTLIWGQKIELPDTALLEDVIRMAEMSEEPVPGSWCASCYSRKHCASAQPASLPWVG